MPDLKFTLTVRDDGTAVVERFGTQTEATASRTRRAASRMSNAFRGLGRGIGRLPGLIFSVKGALIGLGAAAVIRSITRAGNTVEKARLRLTAIRGSLDEANKAFAEMEELAGRVAFSLEDILEAGVTLEAFGAKSKETREAVADLAAFMGIDIVTAAQAFGRAFAAGSGAADVLRERGVLAVVQLRSGIDDLSKLTLPEFRKVLLETLRDPAGPIAESAKLIAETFEGQLSFVGDAFFKLRRRIFESGVGDFAREVFGEVTIAVNVVTKALGEIKLEEFGFSLRDLIPSAQTLVKGFFFLVKGLILFQGALKDIQIVAVKSFKGAATALRNFGVGALGIVKFLIQEFPKPFKVLVKTAREAVNGIATLFDRLGTELASKGPTEAIRATGVELLELAGDLRGASAGLVEIGNVQKTVTALTKAQADVTKTFAGQIQASDIILKDLTGDMVKIQQSFINLTIAEEKAIKRVKEATAAAAEQVIQLEELKRKKEEAAAAEKVRQEKEAAANQLRVDALTQQLGELGLDKFKIKPKIDEEAFGVLQERIARIRELFNALPEEAATRVLEAGNRVQGGLEKQLGFLEKAANKEVALQRAKNDVLAQGTANLFGAIATIAAQGGEKSFGISKAFAVAEALISGAVAVNKALAAPPGPPFTIPLAAAIAAQTFANVRKILSTRPGGGGGAPSAGGGGGGGMAAAGGGPELGAPVQEAREAQPTRIINITVAGFVGDEQKLADELSRLQREGERDGLIFKGE